MFTCQMKYTHNPWGVLQSYASLKWQFDWQSSYCVHHQEYIVQTTKLRGKQYKPKFDKYFYEQRWKIFLLINSLINDII